MKVFFWLSIALWLVALMSYVMILSGNEQLQKKDAGKSVFMPLQTLLENAGYSGSRRIFYRTLVLSAIGAALSGGLFLFTWR
jgi:hypothetical protein